MKLRESVIARSRGWLGFLYQALWVFSFFKVEQVLQALLQLHDEFRKKSKTLLFNDRDFVFLQLAMMKVPEVPEQRRKYV